MYFDHNKIKLEISNRKISEKKSPVVCKVNNVLYKQPVGQGKVLGQLLKFKLSKNENTV